MHVVYASAREPNDPCLLPHICATPYIHPAFSHVINSRMYKYARITAILIAVMAIASACQVEKRISEEPIPRPYEPWIARSVLDERPRMITLALHDDLWAAYNTQTCALYKVWKGYVEWDGAVYTTSHGPQPVTVGDAYVVNVFDTPWRITRGTEELPTRVVYAGHRINNGHAELMYDLISENAGPIRVYELVEAEVSEAGQLGYKRLFNTENVPDGHGVILQTNINSIASQQNISTDGTLRIYEEENKEFGNLQLLEIEGHLELNPNASTTYTVHFVGRPTIKNTYVPAEGLAEDLPLGYRLISRSDCKTCHNKEVRTIGPAYVDIAERYTTNDENVEMLANKVIKGGAGIWGLQVMSPHPDLPITDARSMVQWILDLDEDDTGGAPGADSLSATLEAMEPVEVDESALLPGAFTEVFQIPAGTRLLPRKPSSSPMMAGVMSEFANLGNPDFKGLRDNFAIYASGYLKIPGDGDYEFRLWSDDGSRFWLNDELVINNDSVHPTDFKEATVRLREGYYPFRLEHFQGGGDKFLSLNYKKTGEALFSTVPSTMYFHEVARISEQVGKTLPMSVSSRVPGDQFSLQDVHPGYDLFQARPYDFLPKVGGMDFLDDGRLAVCTWDPSGSVYLLDNLEAEDPAQITVTRIASGLAEPLGLKVVDGHIYIMQKQELTKLVDTDGDDVIDEFLAVSNDWRTSANFHEFTFGLEYKDGFFYANLATAIEPGGASSENQIPDRGKAMKIDAATGKVEFIASGLRTPNGVGFGVDGELFATDNQGDWLPSSKLIHIQPGAWYGSRSVDFEGTADSVETPPVVWLPQDEIGNSPSTPMLLEDGPYAGQMVHGEVTHGGLKRVFVEKVDGSYQGAVFRFVQGLEAGVNRITLGPDGSIYCGGIGNPGNWAQAQKLWYGLQRIKYNNKPVFEMLSVRAKSNGIEIDFTEPLRPADGWDPNDFEVWQWRYVPTSEYGGPKVDERKLNIRSSSVSNDRKTVFLEIEDMKEGHVIYLHLLKHFVSHPGRQLWSTEAWYTMNNIPVNDPGTVLEPSVALSNNTLTDLEAQEGWRLLFDGESFDNWKRFKRDDIGESWIIENGVIKLNAKKDAEGRWYVEDRGDLVTVDEFENFELNLEWRISNCGNSGIIFSVSEDEQFNNTYETGPEMQILDNACHPDTKFPTHRAGDLYDLIECKYVTVKPAGGWNAVRLIKKDGKVEHWLNGIKVVEYEMYTEQWANMLANSKFKQWPAFGTYKKGHIALQDHGDAQVWFRNIKIKEL